MAAAEDIYGAGPVCLLSSNADGKWEVSQDAADTLNRIQQPIASVSIVGKYRTGKSYLMNKLAGCSAGFGLGSTIQSETKGIWMWPIPHPQDPSRCLLLLDTEGLYDVEKGDRTHDMQLFTFALLLSNCMVFNTVGSIDNAFVEELQLVAELTDNVRVKKSNESDEAEEEGTYFANYFPSLFVVLRDFFLELKIGGKEVTLEEYLENSLKLRKGVSKKDQLYNAPRECIRNFFPKRKCFALPKPVSDDKLLRRMEDVTDDQIQPDFLERCQEAVNAIWQAAKPMTIDANDIYGPRFLYMVREYARAVNEGAVPCIESAIDIMKENELRRAYETALQQYAQGMSQSLHDMLPLSSMDLENAHTQWRDHAVDTFRKISVFEEKRTYATQLEDDIEAEYQGFVNKNNEASSERARRALQQCFGPLHDDMKKGTFAVQGGYSLYTSEKERATEQYKELTDIGPMRDKELHRFLMSMQNAEQALITADEALSVAEKKSAEMQLQVEQHQEKIKLDQVEREELMKQNKRQHDEHADMIAALQSDYQEKQARLMQEQNEGIARREEEYREMIDAGMRRQAEQQEMLMDEMRTDKLKMEEENKANREEIARYQQKMVELMETQNKSHQKHQESMAELQKEMNETKQEDLERILTIQAEQASREEKYQKEIANIRHELANVKNAKPSAPGLPSVLGEIVKVGATVALGTVLGPLGGLGAKALFGNK